MQRWSPEEFAAAPAPPGTGAPAADPADAARSFAPAAGAPPFRAEFTELAAPALRGLLTAAEREQVEALARAEAEAAARERAAESERRRDAQAQAFCRELAARLEEQWRAAMAAVAKSGVELALAMAERILRREVARDPAVLARAVEALLYRVPSGAQLVVTAHPEDAAWLEAQPELCARLRVVSVQADRRVARGGCQVACDRRQWDLTVAGQLEALAEAIEAAIEAGETPAEGEDRDDPSALG